MKKMVVIFFAILSVLAGVIACSKSKDDADNNPNCDGIPKSFASDVNPVIQTYCNQAACHNTNSTNGPGALTNYAEVFAARSKIREQVQAGLMPQNANLTTSQKNTIICWIDSGAQNN